MLDHAVNITGAGLPPGDWQQRVQAVFRGCFRQLAEGLTGVAPEAQALNFSLIKETRGSISLQMILGSAEGFLKLFDGPGGAEGYKREKAVLLALAGQGLVPEMISFSDEMRFVMTEWQERPFEPGADPEQTARRIGAWTARYDAAAPARGLQGNWYTYGQQIGLGQALQSIPRAREQLSAVPLCGEVLSHNDAAMHNFLEGADGRLLGCDFEKARFKPRGWDYLKAHWSLLERFPDKAPKVLKALERGFEMSHRGMLQAKELSVVARVLFCAQAVTAANRKETGSWQ